MVIGQGRLRIVSLTMLLGVLGLLVGTSLQGQLGVARAGLEDSDPLTPRGLENIVAFTRLLGYVRYFHPSDQAATTNWDRFTVEGIRAVESVPDAQELARTLDGLFNPLAPTVRVFLAGQRPPLPQELNPPANTQNLQVAMWYHVGLGTPDVPPDVYRSERRFYDAPNGRIPSGVHDPRQPFSAELGGGVASLVPLALFAVERTTLPAVDLPPRPPSIPLSARDRATRLAAVAIAWNVPQHFYPYFDVVDTDWPGALREALQQAAIDRDEVEFLRTLQRLTAQLQDGHGWVSHDADPNTHAPPVRLDWVENQVVVAAVASQQEGISDLKAGDLLLQVEGRPVEERLREVEELISSATPQFKRYNGLIYILAGPRGTELEVTAQTPGQLSRTFRLRRTVSPWLLYPEPRPSEKIKALRPGLLYVDLDRMSDADVERALPQLGGAQGIIFDMRGYPPARGFRMIIQRLINRPVRTAQFLVPVITYPDHEQIREFEDGSWEINPAGELWRAKVAFLTDGRAISRAETYLAFIEYYRLGEIVGGPTAGTNGNNNYIRLPGEYKVSFTGMKVLKQDGSRHHGVGIQPTVTVQRTLRGVAEGRDEVLEKGIELLGFQPTL